MFIVERRYTNDTGASIKNTDCIKKGLCQYLIKFIEKYI